MEKILIVYRDKEFSPNNVEKDRRILSLVAKWLEQAHYELKSVDEVDFCRNTDTKQFLAIVGMPRRLETLTKIMQSGSRAFNAAQGIINTATSRLLTLNLLHDAGVCVPRYWAYNPDEDLKFECESRLQAMLPAWVKAMRCDGVLPGDVVYVETPLQADTEIQRLVKENVQDIVVTCHVSGDLLKVYAVADRQGKIQFLRCFYPQEQGYTKFGDEAHNSSPRRYSVSQTVLDDIVERTARTLGLQFFGLDVIVGQEGNITVIDANDWPSYSIYQDEAAECIARTILADIETY